MPQPDPHHMGEVFTQALPTEDPVLYGTANMEPRGDFPVRSLQSFRLTYTTGRYGLDDTGSIRIVFRFTADGGPLQTTDPKALNYVTATSSNGVPLRLEFSLSASVRPWFQALTIKVHHGYLREGDLITVVLGDRSAGSAGLRLQSMVESAFHWRVLVDMCATGHYVPIADSPVMGVVSGEPAIWKAVLPTLRRPNDPFRFSLKAEDIWGNPSDKVNAVLRLTPSRPVDGLPETVEFRPGRRAVVIEGLSLPDSGALTVTVTNEKGTELCRSNLMQVEITPWQSCWADMHGQSGESVGINTAREYYTFARDYGFLDATSHQANDFQVNAAFWAHLNELSAEFLDEGRFLTLPGYEWSGNTGVGGDRNVYFRTEGQMIRRSSHALIADRAAIHTDAPNARRLFVDLKDQDCLIYAHIGGRPADIAYAHDPKLETAMEIHSAWGTFEWLMQDCFTLGHRVGVVANSDGHKGRPGASYPGASEFGAYGGLTCFLLDRLTRDDLFDCLKNRRHYATTGARIHLDLSVTAETGLSRYAVDPVVRATTPVPVERLGMGDIGSTPAKAVELQFCAQAPAPILQVDVLNGPDLVQTIRNPAPIDSSSRIRILWRGAMVKGRGARADWQGRAVFHDARIKRTAEINAWNPDRRLRQNGAEIHWTSVTAGNFGAFDVWLEEGRAASVVIETNHGKVDLALQDVTAVPTVVALGGLDLELHVMRLPDSLDAGSLNATVDVPLANSRDNPVWIRVTTEDGFQAWTSPVYLIERG